MATLGDEPGEIAALSPLFFNDTAPVIDVSSSRLSVCALFAGGGVRCWGRQRNGNMGQGNSANYVGAQGLHTIPYIKFADDGMVAVQVAATSNFNCALFRNSSGSSANTAVRCWGQKRYVEGVTLNIGSTSAIGDAPGEMEGLGYFSLGTTLPPVRIVAGSTALCVVFDAAAEGDGFRLKCADGYYSQNTNTVENQYSFLVPYPSDRFSSQPFMQVGTPVMDMASPFPLAVPFRGGVAVRFPHRGYLGAAAPVALFNGTAVATVYESPHVFAAVAPPRPDLEAAAAALANTASQAGFCGCSASGLSTHCNCSAGATGGSVGSFFFCKIFFFSVHPYSHPHFLPQPGLRCHWHPWMPVPCERGPERPAG
jgi:hypothetical protein